MDEKEKDVINENNGSKAEENKQEPQEKPAEDKPAEDKPAEDKPAEDPIYNEIRANFDAQLKAQEERFTKQIANRDNIIKQLTSGKSNANNDKPSYIEAINDRRTAQNKY